MELFDPSGDLVPQMRRGVASPVTKEGRHLVVLGNFLGAARTLL
jgi:hypothetical protein